MACKSFLSILFLFFAVANTGMGQKHPQLRFVAFDAGLNMSGIRSASEYQRQPGCFGISAGISGNYSFSDSRSVGVSLEFSQKGAAEYIPDINTKLNYLSLPVFYLYNFKKDPGFFVLGGVYGSCLISASRRGELLNSGQNSRISENITSDFMSFDYGILLGMGMTVRLYDDFDFTVKIRGSAGFSKIKNTDESSPRNYNIGISLGYIYYIGFR